MVRGRGNIMTGKIVFLLVFSIIFLGLTYIYINKFKEWGVPNREELSEDQLKREKQITTLLYSVSILVVVLVSFLAIQGEKLEEKINNDKEQAEETTEDETEKDRGLETPEGFGEDNEEEEEEDISNAFLSDEDRKKQKEKEKLEEAIGGKGEIQVVVDDFTDEMVRVVSEVEVIHEELHEYLTDHSHTTNADKRVEMVENLVDMKAGIKRLEKLESKSDERPAFIKIMEKNTKEVGKDYEDVIKQLEKGIDDVDEREYLYKQGEKDLSEVGKRLADYVAEYVERKEEFENK